MSRSPDPSRRRVLRACARRPCAVRRVRSGNFQASSADHRSVYARGRARHRGAAARAQAAGALGPAFLRREKPGASGTIGTEIVVKVAARRPYDQVGQASIVTAPHLYPKISYDVVKDLSASRTSARQPRAVVHNRCGRHGAESSPG